MLGKLQLSMHTLERALYELVALQRKILKSEWIVLQNYGCPNRIQFLESLWKEWILLCLNTKRYQFQVLELGATAPFIVPRAAQGPARPASPYEESKMHGNKLPPCPGRQTPTHPPCTPWLLVITQWCSLHCSGITDRTIFAVSLCWPSLFSALPT